MAWGSPPPQIAVLKRVLVIDTSPRQEGQKLIHFVNPEILKYEGKTVYTEGCLSVPGEAEEVERAAKVWVRALDYHGKPFELEADGLLAIAVQHETDHLNGTFFVDYLSSLQARAHPKADEEAQGRASSSAGRGARAAAGHEKAL